MRRYGFAVAAAAVAVCLAGCATTPVSSSTAPVVPQERILSAQLTTPFDGAATIIVARDSGMMGAACKARLSIDGQPAADLSPGERVIAYVSDGEHVLGATASGICGGGRAETSAVLRSGQTKSFRISSGQSGDYSISATAF